MTEADPGGHTEADPEGHTRCSTQKPILMFRKSKKTLCTATQFDSRELISYKKNGPSAPARDHHVRLQTRSGVWGGGS